METPDKNLRANLDREMAARGWKVAQLARECGLSPSTLYPIWDERQLAWPQPATLAKLADGLGISVGGLLSDGADPGRSAKLQLLELVAALNESQAKRLLPEAQIVASGFGASAAAKAEELETDEGESGSG